MKELSCLGSHAAHTVGSRGWGCQYAEALAFIGALYSLPLLSPLVQQLIIHMFWFTEGWTFAVDQGKESGLVLKVRELRLLAREWFI